jgi:hypothetical protein
MIQAFRRAGLYPYSAALSLPSTIRREGAARAENA